MDSNCSASPMIRRLQAHIRARASFRMAVAAPLSCSSESDREATLTRDHSPPPQVGTMGSEKMLPEDYQLVFVTSSDCTESSDADADGEIGGKKKRRKRRRKPILKVKSRLEFGSGAMYIEDSDWEFTSDSDYRLAASLCSLDEISDVEETLKEKVKIIEKKSASLEDLPSLFTRTGSVRLQRNNSVRRSMRKSMRLRQNPLLMKKKEAKDAADCATTVMCKECNKCGGVKIIQEDGKTLKKIAPLSPAKDVHQHCQTNDLGTDANKNGRSMKKTGWVKNIQASSSDSIKSQTKNIQDQPIEQNCGEENDCKINNIHITNSNNDVNTHTVNSKEDSAMHMRAERCDPGEDPEFPSDVGNRQDGRDLVRDTDGSMRTNLNGSHLRENNSSEIDLTKNKIKYQPDVGGDNEGVGDLDRPRPEANNGQHSYSLKETKNLQGSDASANVGSSDYKMKMTSPFSDLRSAEQHLQENQLENESHLLCDSNVIKNINSKQQLIKQTATTIVSNNIVNNNEMKVGGKFENMATSKPLESSMKRVVIHPQGILGEKSTKRIQDPTVHQIPIATVEDTECHSSSVVARKRCDLSDKTLEQNNAQIASIVKIADGKLQNIIYRDSTDSCRVLDTTGGNTDKIIENCTAEDHAVSIIENTNSTDNKVILDCRRRCDDTSGKSERNPTSGITGVSELSLQVNNSSNIGHSTSDDTEKLPTEASRQSIKGEKVNILPSSGGKMWRESLQRGNSHHAGLWDLRQPDTTSLHNSSTNQASLNDCTDQFSRGIPHDGSRQVLYVNQQSQAGKQNRKLWQISSNLSNNCFINPKDNNSRADSLCSDEISVESPDCVGLDSKSSVHLDNDIQCSNFSSGESSCDSYCVSPPGEFGLRKDTSYNSDLSVCVEQCKSSKPKGISRYFPVKDAPPFENSVSSLEKYFTEELLIPQQSPEFDDYDSDFDPPIPPAHGYLIEEEVLSDASTSSDDALFSVPLKDNSLSGSQPTSLRMYGNPNAFSLHTIVEDSCEESEQSAPSSPQVRRQPSELEHYFSYAIGNGNEDEQKRWSVVSEDLSDTVSEASYVSEVTEEDPSLMASSRLEKYFTNLVGGCGSETGSLKEVEIEEERLQSGCFEEDSYNTIKRNKKVKDTKEELNMDKIKSDSDVTVIHVETTSPRPSSKSEKESSNVDENVVKLEIAQDDKCDSDDGEVAKMDMGEEEEEVDDDIAKIVDVVEKISPTPTSPVDEIDAPPLKAIRLTEQLENIAINGKMKRDQDKTEITQSVKERMAKFETADTIPLVIKPKVSPRSSPSKHSPDLLKKVTFIKDFPKDEEAAYVVNRVIAHISGVEKPEFEEKFPAESGWKSLLENQIINLMQTVSPNNGSSNSTAASSNNSDYGSDTLESEEFGCTDDDRINEKDRLSDETLFICKKLMTSLKQLSSKSPSPPLVNEYAKAQEYIQDQIVALMHTVTASRNTSPMLKDKKVLESPNLSEKQSESGSETVSASISIPSYDSDETSATEPIHNNEMDDLYNLLSDNISLSKLSCCDGETDHKTMLKVNSSPQKPPVPTPRNRNSTQKCVSPVQIIRISSPPSKCDSTSTLTTGSDIDFAGSVETVLEVAQSPIEPSSSATNDISRSEPSLYDKKTNMSSDELATLKTQLAASKASSKSEYSIDGVDETMQAKSVSEHNLFSNADAQEGDSVNGAKSVGNIVDTRSRDTGYYSFKSSDESVEGNQKEHTSEPVRPARSVRNTGGKLSQKVMSTPNITESFDSKCLTLPSKLKKSSEPTVVELNPEVTSMTLKPSKDKHFSSAFFSNSGVLRKLTLKVVNAVVIALEM